jgi:hypothetical protein
LAPPAQIPVEGEKACREGWAGMTWGNNEKAGNCFATLGGTMDSGMKKIQEQSINAKGIKVDDALELYELGNRKPFVLMACASEIREHLRARPSPFVAS